MKLFSGRKQNLERFSSSAKLLGFPDCWMFGLRDFTVFTCILFTICLKHVLIGPTNLMEKQIC